MPHRDLAALAALLIKVEHPLITSMIKTPALQGRHGTGAGRRVDENTNDGSIPIAREYLNRVPQEYRTVLAQRHSPAPAKGKTPKQPVEIGSALKNLDEAGYNRLLIEMSLLDATSHSYSCDGAER